MSQHLMWISLYLETNGARRTWMEKDEEFILLALNAYRSVEVCLLFLNHNNTSEISSSDEGIQSLLVKEGEQNSFENIKINNYISGLSLVDFSQRRKKASQRFKQTWEILYSKCKEDF